MRHHGVISSAAGVTASSHLGWGYRGRSDFRARAAEFIADGLAANQWVRYVGDGSRQALRAELTATGFGSSLKSGRVWVTPMEDYYTFHPGTDVIDAEATVAAGVALIEGLAAAGRAGVCGVIDGTAVARTPEQRDALARFEHLADQMVTRFEVSALCAYDVSVLGAGAKEIVCMHPLVGAGVVGFQVYADEGSDFALAGEIDAADHRAFTATLRRIWPLMASRELVIDAHDLSFVTHHELLVLDRRARADGREVVLRTNRPTVARLVELLRLANVRVQSNPVPAGSGGGRAAEAGS